MVELVRSTLDGDGDGDGAYAFERPALLGGTIAEVIAYGRPAAAPAAVRAAAVAAETDGFVRRLPDGYDTPLRRTPMSGGEAQRLGLARAIAQGERVLVLDDAPSSLDTATEMKVGAALARLGCSPATCGRAAARSRGWPAGRWWRRCRRWRRAGWWRSRSPGCTCPPALVVLLDEATAHLDPPPRRGRRRRSPAGRAPWWWSPTGSARRCTPTWSATGRAPARPRRPPRPPGPGPRRPRRLDAPVNRPPEQRSPRRARRRTW
jgi:hypothetical protein